MAVVEHYKPGQIPCDGCGEFMEIAKARYYEGRGHVMAYCESTCAPIYAAFEKAHEAEAARQQRLLELWAADVRSRLPLRVTPVELPQLVVGRNRQPIRLG